MWLFKHSWNKHTMARLCASVGPDVSPRKLMNIFRQNFIFRDIPRNCEVNLILIPTQSNIYITRRGKRTQDIPLHTHKNGAWQKYYHVSGIPWLIITYSGLDLRTPSFTLFLNCNQLQELTRNLLPRTRSILVLRLTILSVVLCCTPLYSHSPNSRSSTTILL
jgi:hypothetical protein